MIGKKGEKHDEMGEFYVQTWNWEKNQECWVGVLPHIHLFLHIVFNNLFILSFWSLDWGLTWDDISFQRRNYPIPKSVRQKGLNWAFHFIYGMISCWLCFFGLLPHLSVVEDASTQSMWCTLLSGWARLAFSPSQWDPSSKHTNTLYAWHKTQWHMSDNHKEGKECRHRTPL